MSDNYSRLLNNDSGSNYSFADNVNPDSIPRSGFNWSYVTSGTVEEGQILPVMVKLTLPKTDMELKLQSIIKVVNPPKVALLSRQRVIYHGYWASFTQLWKNAQTFFKLGTSIAQTKVKRYIPKISIPVEYLKNTDLANFLGFRFAKLPGSGTVEVPALKFMFYIKVYRDYYMNKRIVSQYLYNDSISNSTTATTSSVLYDFLFPDDDADFRIGSSQWNAVIADSGALAYLCTIKFRDYAPDYFTSAQLTPILGDEPSIAVNSASVTAEFISKITNDYNTSVLGQPYVSSGINPGSTTQSFTFNNNTSQTRVQLGGSFYQSENFTTSPISIIGSKITDGKTDYSDAYLAAALEHNSPDNIKYDGREFARLLNNSVGINVTAADISPITQDTIRNLASATAILEKLAKTDGTYREFAKIMFGETPKAAYDFTPTLIGGSYQSILYSDIVNTTGSFVAGSDVPTSNPQGTMSGKGMSAGDGYIGRFHSDDYGYVMVVASIMPDTYYVQGLDKTDTYETPEDFYLPDRAGLGMQAILNKEIYNDPTSADNEKVFGYINRFDELRYNQNEVHGKLADPTNKTFFPYVQSRYFESCPTLSPEFLTTENNISKDWLTSITEVPFIYQIAFNFRGVAPMPYKAQPSYLGL